MLEMRDQESSILSSFSILTVIPFADECIDKVHHQTASEFKKRRNYLYACLLRFYKILCK